MSELVKVIYHELTVETHARFAHEVWCGSAVTYEQCSDLQKHREEGEEVAQAIKCSSCDRTKDQLEDRELCCPNPVSHA